MHAREMYLGPCTHGPGNRLRWYGSVGKLPSVEGIAGFVRLDWKRLIFI
jgi:hypothetical protein